MRPLKLRLEVLTQTSPGASEGADVAARLVYQLLDVVELVLVAAQNLLVLQDRLGGVAVVDLRKQPAPAPHHRLHHHRVAHRLDELEGFLGFGSERGAGLRHAVGLEGAAGGPLVAADLDHFGAVYHGDAQAAEVAAYGQALALAH